MEAGRSGGGGGDDEGASVRYFETRIYLFKCNTEPEHSRDEQGELTFFLKFQGCERKSLIIIIRIHSVGHKKAKDLSSLH